jgi:vacuolar-type H+-ATPase subunit H
MEAERQTHQKKEQALCARVVETEKHRDAAIQEALKNSEAMKSLVATKKECNGIAGSFGFLLYSNFPFC